jgi:hypothetical protein
MDLSGIISISGKPGLYKVVAQAKNSLIVESLIDGKRIPAYAAHRVSALEDISIYTQTEDVPLADVYRAMYDKENGGAIKDHKSDMSELRAYLEEVLPDCDQERVYNSDLKKLFQWYNLLHSTENLKLKEEEGAAEEEATEEAVAETVETVEETAAEATEEESTEEAPEETAEEEKEEAAPEE